MTLRELKQHIDQTLDMTPNRDQDVVVRLNHPGSMGGTPCTLVTNANSGFDWDSGKFILTTADSIASTRLRIKQKVMTPSEIKKYLYKNKPVAKRVADLPSVSLYQADIEDHYVSFRIPKEEMGETPFEEEMPAQLLIRWLV